MGSEQASSQNITQLMFQSKGKGLKIEQNVFVLILMNLLNVFGIPGRYTDEPIERFSDTK